MPGRRIDPIKQFEKEHDKLLSALKKDVKKDIAMMEQKIKEERPAVKKMKAVKAPPAIEDGDKPKSTRAKKSAFAFPPPPVMPTLTPEQIEFDKKQRIRMKEIEKEERKERGKRALKKLPTRVKSGQIMPFGGGMPAPVDLSMFPLPPPPKRK